MIEVSHDMLGGVFLILVTTLLSLWALHLVKVKVKYFWFYRWPLDWSVTWLCGWGPSTLSHPRFGVHKPCWSVDTTFFICHVTMTSKCHVTCGWGSFILSHHPATFGVHRPGDISGDITFFICHVTTIWKCHVTLWVESSHPKSQPCWAWDPYALWNWK